MLELGYFYGKLGRDKVVTLVKGNVNTLGDTAGIVTIPIDEGGEWKNKTIRDLKKAGIKIDANILTD
jgi:predicted nucleotide-binding protein